MLLLFPLETHFGWEAVSVAVAHEQTGQTHEISLFTGGEFYNCQLRKSMDFPKKFAGK
jgi:hypothetical protein